MRSIFEHGRKLLQNRVGEQKQSLVAIVLKKRKIVSVGYNSYCKTHPSQAAFARGVGQEKRIYIHAEISALLKAPKGSDTIIILRLNKNGELGNAKPCPICSEAIKQFGITKIIHS